MENALIVTYSDKNAALINGLVSAFSVVETTHVRTVAKARQVLLERSFNYVIINMPLSDETGEAFAKQIVSKGSTQVLLIVAAQIYEHVAEICEKAGVFTVQKPLNRDVFRQVFGLARTLKAKREIEITQNELLRQKIETIRAIDRAKVILMSFYGMSEQDSHRFIEKRAMDLRKRKFDISKQIINDYENGISNGEDY